LIQGIKILLAELWYFFTDYFDYINEILYGEKDDTGTKRKSK